jgi:hypothetical protein
MKNKTEDFKPSALGEDWKGLSGLLQVNSGVLCWRVGSHPTGDYCQA